MRLRTLLVDVAHFVKVVLVELSDETCKVAVLEMLRKYVFRELFILQSIVSALCHECERAPYADLEHDKAVAFVPPPDHLFVGRVLEHPAVTVNQRHSISKGWRRQNKRTCIACAPAAT